MFAHQPAQLLAVDHPPIALALELVADRADPGENLGGVPAPLCSVVEGGSRQTHQLAAFADGDAAGPVKTEVLALLGRGACFKAPFSSSISSAWRPTIRSSAAILASYSWSRSAVCTSSSSALASNLPTQMRISCREMSCRCDNACSVSARDELLRNLPLERGAVQSMLRHGFHPPKPARGVNSNRPSCPPAGAHSKLPGGLPSHDTFSGPFRLLDPVAFAACFAHFLDGLGVVGPGVIAIDGKTMQRPFDRAAGRSALHVVTAFAADARVLIGQVAAGDKASEIVAARALLGLLDLRGALVTATRCTARARRPASSRSAAVTCCSR